MTGRKRKIFPIIGTYQGKMIFFVFVPAVIFHLCIFCMLTFLKLDLGMLIFQGVSEEVIAYFIDNWSATVILVSLFFVAAFLIISFIISRNMVGAFERIVRELDEVIEGKRVGPLTARRYDVLAKDLLQRVNVLIEKRRDV